MKMNLQIWCICAVSILGIVLANRSAGQDHSVQKSNLPDVRIPDGTLMRLVVVDSVFAKSAKVGDHIRLRVLDEVREENLVIVANKAVAQATISEIRPPRRALRTGSMILIFDFVTLVNDQHLPLQGNGRCLGPSTEAGADMLELAQATRGVALPFSPLLLIAHGNAPVLRQGTVLEAFSKGDTHFSREKLEMSQPPPLPKREGPASVTIYWLDDGHVGGGKIWCGRVKLGGLRAGQNMTLHLAAGKYWFRSYDKKRAVGLTVEAAGQYFLRAVPFGPGSPVEHYLSFVEHDVGEAEASGTKVAPHDKLISISGVGLADLQANPSK